MIIMNELLHLYIDDLKSINVNLEVHRVRMNPLNAPLV